MEFKHKEGRWTAQDGQLEITLGIRAAIYNNYPLGDWSVSHGKGRPRPYTGYAVGLEWPNMYIRPAFFTKTVMGQLIIMRDIIEIMKPAGETIGSERIKHYIRKLVRRYRTKARYRWDDQGSHWWICIVSPCRLRRRV